MEILSQEQARRLWIRAGRLSEPATGGPAAALAAVGATQAQELLAGYLSIRARGEGITLEGVERARVEQRSMGWCYCIRGTLHLVMSEDIRWLTPLMGAALAAGDRRRMSALGWDEERTARGLDLLERMLAEQGALSRSEIKTLLRQNNLPVEGQAPIHLIFRAAVEGRICLAEVKGRDTVYRLFEAWYGQPARLEREEGLARLVRMYLKAYGPASPEDLATWSGLRMSEARAAWELIAGERVEVSLAGKRAWLTREQAEWLADGRKRVETVTRLLPAWDTYLLGHAGRDLLIEPEHAARLKVTGGVIPATLLVDGMVKGTWKLTRRRQRVEIRLEPFERLNEQIVAGFTREADEIGRFFGLPVEIRVAT